MDAVGSGLTVYGPLGLFCFILVTAIGYLWRSGIAERRELMNQFLKLDDRYHAEMRDLAQQKIDLAEKWIEKYAEFAKVSAEILDRATDKRR